MPSIDSEIEGPSKNINKYNETNQYISAKKDLISCKLSPNDLNDGCSISMD